MGQIEDVRVIHNNLGLLSAFVNTSNNECGLDNLLSARVNVILDDYFTGFFTFPLSSWISLSVFGSVSANVDINLDYILNT